MLKSSIKKEALKKRKENLFGSTAQILESGPIQESLSTPHKVNIFFPDTLLLS